MFISKKKLQEMIQEEKDKVWEQVEEDRFHRETLDRLFRVEDRMIDLDKKVKEVTERLNKLVKDQMIDLDKKVKEVTERLNKL